jgi:hypothetical protein
MYRSNFNTLLAREGTRTSGRVRGSAVPSRWTATAHSSPAGGAEREAGKRPSRERTGGADRPAQKGGRGQRRRVTGRHPGGATALTATVPARRIPRLHCLPFPSFRFRPCLALVVAAPALGGEGFGGAVKFSAFSARECAGGPRVRP